MINRRRVFSLFIHMTVVILTPNFFRHSCCNWYTVDLEIIEGKGRVHHRRELSLSERREPGRTSNCTGMLLIIDYLIQQ